MKHPSELRIEDFTYLLPENRIANFPLAERDESRLLIYRKGYITEGTYKNLSGQLPENSRLIFNDSRVIRARMLFTKPSGGSIEIFALEPDSRYRDISTAMLQTGSVVWKCLVGGAAKWKPELRLQKPLNNEGALLEAELTDRGKNDFTVTFHWQPATLSFAEVLHQAGSTPIPPYLKREAQDSDTERYQTIYAREDGSVAAPTAGLHFTESIFETLANKGIEYDFVTLHVGAGTFMPVKSASMSGHNMHEEFMDISEKLIEKLLIQPRPLFCVGTTSLRTIESLYWMGVKCWVSPDISYNELALQQWEVYDTLEEKQIALPDALQALLNWMKQRRLDRLVIKTQLLIAPGYKFHLCDGLITNFHQPQSTLLLLVAALIGDDWKKLYAYALEKNFRFLSYGDGCLLIKS